MAATPEDPFAEADRFARRHFSPLRRLAMWRDRRRAARELPASIIRASWPGVQPSSSRLCLFSHFDPQGRIDPFVRSLLEALRVAGFDVILLTSSPFLEAGEVDAIRALCTRVIHRTNIGMDFGGWRDAITQLGEQLGAYDELLLTNDSVYGPLVPLDPILETMRRRDNDFWGMTDCRVLGHHLQSYFLVLRRPVLSSDAFKRFWRDFVFFRCKDNIIRDYEVGLTARLSAAGFRFDAYCRMEDLARTEADTPETEDLIDRRARGLVFDSSPPIAYWKALVLRHGYPFVKRELVRDNPYRLPSVAQLPEVVRRVGNYDVELIRSNLRRLGHSGPI